MNASLAKRVPDVQLFTPAQRGCTKATTNVGRFYIVVFAGDPASTETSLEYKCLVKAASHAPFFTERPLPIS